MLDMSKVTIPPKFDLVFKYIFGTQKNKDILIDLLNAILDIKIENLININTESVPDSNEGKHSYMDIVVQTVSGELINIEIQLADKGDMVERSLYYWSNLYSGSIQKGEPYSLLKRTICINLLDYNLFPKKNFHTICDLVDRETKEIVTRVIEIHFIEMKKMKFEECKNTALGLWIEFLNNPQNEEINVNKNILRAKEELLEANMKPTIKERFALMKSLENSKQDELFLQTVEHAKGIIEHLNPTDDILKNILKVNNEQLMAIKNVIENSKLRNKNINKSI